MEIDIGKGCKGGKPYRDNLGGLGPDAGPAEVRYRGVGTRWVKGPPTVHAAGGGGAAFTELGAYEEQSFDLVVTNTTPYFRVEDGLPGVVHPEERIASSCSLLLAVGNLLLPRVRS